MTAAVVPGTGVVDVAAQPVDGQPPAVQGPSQYEAASGALEAKA